MSDWEGVEELVVEISTDDKAMIVIHSQLLFLWMFFGDELTVPPERDDLPDEWHGQQIMSEKQRIMTCDRARQVAMRTSRKIAKTIILCGAFFRWTWWHAGRGPTDGLLHCPREHHLTNIRLRIEKKISYVPVFRLLVTGINRSKGFMETSTGITWFLRIEGRTGTGESMVGPAASYELGDEQDYANWGAFNERQQAVLPNSLRMLGGVPRGVQGGPFWAIANRKDYGADWSVFSGKTGYNCFINPIYQSDKAKQRLILDHGGTETQAYQTQVLGLDGAKVFSSFPVIPTAARDFARVEVTGNDVDTGFLEGELTRIPRVPSEVYMIAGDLGRSPSPTELAVLRTLDEAWIEMARVHITVADSFQTSAAIHTLNMCLPRPAKLIVLDAHGQGTGILDNLHKNEKWLHHNYANIAIDAEFNSYVSDERRLVHSTCKRLVRNTPGGGWHCDACSIPIFRRDDLEPDRVPTKQWAFAALKDSFASGQRWLLGEKQRLDYPPLILSVEDEPLLMSLEGTTEKETATGRVAWDAPSRHLVDMLLAAEIGIHRLEVMGKEEQVPDWLDELGWTGTGTAVAMPWEAMVAGG